MVSVASKMTLEKSLVVPEIHADRGGGQDASAAIECRCPSALPSSAGARDPRHSPLCASLSSVSDCLWIPQTRHFYHCDFIASRRVFNNGNL